MHVYTYIYVDACSVYLYNMNIHIHAGFCYRHFQTKWLRIMAVYSFSLFCRLVGQFWSDVVKLVLAGNSHIASGQLPGQLVA